MTAPMADERLTAVYRELATHKDGCDCTPCVVTAEVDRLRSIVDALDTELVATAERVAWERTHAPLRDGWTAEAFFEDAVELSGPQGTYVVDHDPHSADRWRTWDEGDACVADTLAELIEQVTA